MQLSLRPSTFEYEGDIRVRSILVNGDPWFYGLDVCVALDLGNPSAAFARLDEDEKRTLTSSEGSRKVTRVNPLLISESGLYSLIFQSRKPEAKAFKRWVTAEVLPQIRKTGAYRTNLTDVPIFIRRFNDNWDRVEAGFFSVIGELGIRLFGRLEKLGHILPDQGEHGREMRPDVSVGIHFSKWLAVAHPSHCQGRKAYSHLLPNGNQCEAYQYPLATLPIFIDYVDNIWMREHARGYLSDKDPAALEYLPKLLPVASMPPKAAEGRFAKIKQVIDQSEKFTPPLELPASEESARKHFKLVRDILGIPPKPGEYLEDPETSED